MIGAGLDFESDRLYFQRPDIKIVCGFWSRYLRDGGPCMEKCTVLRLVHGGCIDRGIVSHISAKDGSVCPMQGMGDYDNDKVPVRPFMLSFVFKQHTLETHECDKGTIEVSDNCKERVSKLKLRLMSIGA